MTDNIQANRELRGRLLSQAETHIHSGDLKAAANSYSDAVRAHESVLNAHPLQKEKFDVLAEARHIYAEYAYLLLRLVRPAEALHALERGRTKILGESYLRRLHLPLSFYHHSEVAGAECFNHVGQIFELERRERRFWATSNDSGDKSELERIRDTLNRKLEQFKLFLSTHSDFDYDEWLAGARILAVEEAASKIGAVAYIATTRYGTCFVCLKHDASSRNFEISFRCIDSFTLSDFMTLVSVATEDAKSILMATSGSFLRAANALPHLEKTPVWYDLLHYMDGAFESIGRQLIHPMTECISQLGIDDIGLVLSGELCQIPVNVIPFVSNGERCYLTDFCYPRVLFSSVCFLATWNMGALARGTPKSRIAIYSEDLMGADVDYFARTNEDAGKIYKLTSADRDRFRSMSTKNSEILFSCHGLFKYWNQLDSSLCVNGNILFSLYDFLDDLILPGCKLAIAAACQSGFQDSTTTLDEGVSLALGMQMSGAEFVVGALWTIDDLATSLFVVRLLQELAADIDYRPWRAVVNVQRWFRRQSTNDLINYMRSIPELSELIAKRGIETVDDMFVVASKSEVPGRRFLVMEMGANDPRSVEPTEGCHPWFWGGFVAFG